MTQIVFHQNLSIGMLFTDNFVLIIQIGYKFCFALIRFLTTGSPPSFAHTTTAQLCCVMCRTCSDHHIQIWMKAKQNLHRMWNMIGKLLTKWACGSHFIKRNAHNPNLMDWIPLNYLITMKGLPYSFPCVRAVIFYRTYFFMGRQICWTNPTMHQFHIPQCTIL